MTIELQISQKSHFDYSCVICDYFTCNKKDMSKHLQTVKHKKNVDSYNLDKNSYVLGDLSQNKLYFCKCGKKYKYRQGLCNHKKKCLYKEDIDLTNISSELIIELIKDNKEIKEKLIKDNREIKEQFFKEKEKFMKENDELRKQITELIPKVGNYNNNTINQNVNINVFLNEQCKDAINMGDFIKSIKVSLEQLDYTKNKGLVDGLTNVFIENINKLSFNERPLHCTDVKREVLYIKDDDIWEKDKSKQKIKKAIKDVSNKQYFALNDWKKENKDYLDNDEKKDYFVKAISTIGKGNDSVDNKIIKKICTNTYIKDMPDKIK